jgi:hypothetical protein
MRGLVITGTIVETSHQHLIEVEESSSEPFAGQALNNDNLDIIANDQINHILNHWVSSNNHLENLI